MLPFLAVTQSQLVQEALTLMIVGMGVVFLGLVLLMIVSVLINRLGSEPKAPVSTKSATAIPRQHASTTASPHAAGSTQSDSKLDPKVVAVLAAAATRAQTHDPRLIAVLTAAASAALNRPVHIRTARHFLGGKTIPQHSWSQMGRRSIMTSHRPKRK